MRLLILYHFLAISLILGLACTPQAEPEGYHAIQQLAHTHERASVPLETGGSLEDIGTLFFLDLDSGQSPYRGGTLHVTTSGKLLLYFQVCWATLEGERVAYPGFAGECGPGTEGQFLTYSLAPYPEFIDGLK